MLLRALADGGLEVDGVPVQQPSERHLGGRDGPGVGVPPALKLLEAKAQSLTEPKNIS